MRFLFAEGIARCKFEYYPILLAFGIGFDFNFACAYVALKKR